MKSPNEKLSFNGIEVEVHQTLETPMLLKPHFFLHLKLKSIVTRDHTGKDVVAFKTHSRAVDYNNLPNIEVRTVSVWPNKHSLVTDREYIVYIAGLRQSNVDYALTAGCMGFIFDVTKRECLFPIETVNRWYRDTILKYETGPI